MSTKKYLSGEAYWTLHDLMEDGEKKLSLYAEWAREQCRKLKLLPDITDLAQGVVYDEPFDPKNPSKLRRVVQLVEDEEVIQEAIRRKSAVDVVNSDIAEAIKKIAKKAGVRVDSINPKEGTIDFSDSALMLDLSVD